MFWMLQDAIKSHKLTKLSGCGISSERPTQQYCLLKKTFSNSQVIREGNIVSLVLVFPMSKYASERVVCYKYCLAK